mmetsp:Transcript_40188/g.113798  ORF Transcript_40188/g.113798 Transcript_40188/m.113798 type:complete len:285 (-) Transcript_40188:954-1808(-)
MAGQTTFPMMAFLPWGCGCLKLPHHHPHTGREASSSRRVNKQLTRILPRILQRRLHMVAQQLQRKGKRVMRSWSSRTRRRRCTPPGSRVPTAAWTRTSCLLSKRRHRDSVHSLGARNFKEPLLRCQAPHSYRKSRLGARPLGARPCPVPPKKFQLCLCQCGMWRTHGLANSYLQQSDTRRPVFTTHVTSTQPTTTAWSSRSWPASRAAAQETRSACSRRHVSGTLRLWTSVPTPMRSSTTGEWLCLIWLAWPRLIALPTTATSCVRLATNTPQLCVGTPGTPRH